MTKESRQAVSAQALADNPGIQGYLYLKENADVGLDPWVSINGVDVFRDGSQIILEWGSSGAIQVDPYFTVYVEKGIYCITNEEKSDQKWRTQ